MVHCELPLLIMQLFAINTHTNINSLCHMNSGNGVSWVFISQLPYERESKPTTRKTVVSGGMVDLV